MALSFAEVSFLNNSLGEHSDIHATMSFNFSEALILSDVVSPSVLLNSISLNA